MKKLNRLKCFILVGLFAFVSFINQDVNAQTVKWPNGDEFVKCLGGDLYTRVPKGAYKYKITDGKFWRIINDIQDFEPITYYEVDGDKVYYYEGDNKVGLYEASSGRYTAISGEKEVTVALLQEDGIILNSNAELIYSVDKQFNPLILGFFIFFGY